jgi:hypothetical protein
MLTAAQRASSNVIIPYGEATFSITVPNNSFTSSSALTRVQDNGLQRLGFNIVNTGSGAITLGAKGAWLVSVTTAWPASATGYRNTVLYLDFSGGTYGAELCNPPAIAFSQTTQANFQVATNASYSAYISLYQNSGASLSVTGTIRAVHLGGVTP